MYRIVFQGNIGNTDLSGAVEQFHRLSCLLLLLPHLHWTQWLPGGVENAVIDNLRFCNKIFSKRLLSFFITFLWTQCASCYGDSHLLVEAGHSQCNNAGMVEKIISSSKWWVDIWFLAGGWLNLATLCVSGTTSWLLVSLSTSLWWWSFLYTSWEGEPEKGNNMNMHGSAKSSFGPNRPAQG